MQASRQSESLIVRPPTGTSRLVGGETVRTFTKTFKKHRKSFANSDERKVLPKVLIDHILYQLVCCCMPISALDRCIYVYAYTYTYIYIHTYIYYMRINKRLYTFSSSRPSTILRPLFRYSKNASFYLEFYLRLINQTLS